MTVTPQSNATLADIAQAMLQRDNFCICGHVSPDGDCIGSQLALAAALQQRGKQVACVLARNEPLEEGLRGLPGVDSLCYAGTYAGPCDVFVFVDVPTRARIADAAPLFDAAPFSMTIDHHANPERVSDLSYTDADAASTTVLVWQLTELLGACRTPDIAACCYMGLMTDTGRFQYQNADEQAFSSAAEMVAAGADVAALARQFYQSRTLASVKLESRAIGRMRLLAQGRIALSYITREDMAQLGAVKSDAEPLIDALRSLSGVRVACLLRDQGEEVRGSFRAKDDTDVAAIAGEFGGGGHKSAAGFSLAGPIGHAVKAVSERLAQLYPDVSGGGNPDAPVDGNSGSVRHGDSHAAADGGSGDPACSFPDSCSGGNA